MTNDVTRPKTVTPMIAIIGPDGAGKSTIISSLANEYSHARIKRVFLFNRNYKKSNTGGAIRNYAKPPYSTAVTIVKLSIKAISWIIEYYTRIRPIQRSGTLIIGDHFYFLITLLDPLKARLSGPEFIRRFFYRIVPKPAYYVYLDAPLDIVYSRKQETTREELDQLINRHRNFLSSTPNTVSVDANRPVKEIVVDISQIIDRIIDTSFRE